VIEEEVMAKRKLTRKRVSHRNLVKGDTTPAESVGLQPAGERVETGAEDDFSLERDQVDPSTQDTPRSQQDSDEWGERR
jgi:hypothetical protein